MLHFVIDIRYLHVCYDIHSKQEAPRRNLLKVPLHPFHSRLSDFSGELTKQREAT